MSNGYREPLPNGLPGLNSGDAAWRRWYIEQSQPQVRSWELAVRALARHGVPLLSRTSPGVWQDSPLSTGLLPAALPGDRGGLPMLRVSLMPENARRVIGALAALGQDGMPTDQMARQARHDTIDGQAVGLKLEAWLALPESSPEPAAPAVRYSELGGASADRSVVVTDDDELSTEIGVVNRWLYPLALFGDSNVAELWRPGGAPPLQQSLEAAQAAARPAMDLYRDIEQVLQTI